MDTTNLEESANVSPSTEAPTHTSTSEVCDTSLGPDSIIHKPEVLPSDPPLGESSKTPSFGISSSRSAFSSAFSSGGVFGGSFSVALGTNADSGNDNNNNNVNNSSTNVFGQRAGSAFSSSNPFSNAERPSVFAAVGSSVFAPSPAASSFSAALKSSTGLPFANPFASTGTPSMGAFAVSSTTPNEDIEYKDENEGEQQPDYGEGNESEEGEEEREDECTQHEESGEEQHEESEEEQHESDDQSQNLPHHVDEKLDEHVQKDDDDNLQLHHDQSSHAERQAQQQEDTDDTNNQQQEDGHQQPEEHEAEGTDNRHEGVVTQDQLKHEDDSEVIFQKQEEFQTEPLRETDQHQEDNNEQPQDDEDNTKEKHEDVDAEEKIEEQIENKVQDQENVSTDEVPFVNNAEQSQEDDQFEQQEDGDNENEKGCEAVREQQQDDNEELSDNQQQHERGGDVHSSVPENENLQPQENNEYCVPCEEADDNTKVANENQLQEKHDDRASNKDDITEPESVSPPTATVSTNLFSSLSHSVFANAPQGASSLNRANSLSAVFSAVPSQIQKGPQNVFGAVSMATATALPSLPLNSDSKAAPVPTGFSAAEKTALETAHAAVVEQMQKEMTEFKKKYRDSLLALKATKEDLETKKSEMLTLTAKLEERATEAERLKVELASKDEELAVEREKEAALVAELEKVPKQAELVKRIDIQLREWFDTFAGQQQQLVQDQLRGVGASEDSHDDDNESNSIPNVACRSVQSLRDFFSLRLIALSEETASYASALAAARSDSAAKDEALAIAKTHVGALEAEVDSLKAAEGSALGSVQGALEDSLAYSSSLEEALAAAKAAMKIANRSILEQSERAENAERRLTLLLATKESLAAELDTCKKNAAVAVRTLEAHLETALATKAEETLSLKRQISTLSAMATRALAEETEVAKRRNLSEERKIANLESDRPTKVFRAEESHAPQVIPEEEGNDTKKADDASRAEEALLNTPLEVFCPPQAEVTKGSSALPSNLGEAKAEHIRSLACRLGLPNVGQKRERSLNPPSFAEAAAFFAKGQRYIEDVQKENSTLRKMLARARGAEAAAKSLEVTRGQTVATFAALHEEVEHLRADNKKVRDEVVGLKAENSVLSSQLVSLLLSGSQSVTAVASPIAPLPPAALPTSSRSDGFRLHPRSEPDDYIQSNVAECLATIRRCATEMSERNSSATTNPEVQAAAAKHLQHVKNETMRLTKHMDGLLKLIEPREQRLASITAQLVRHAASHPTEKVNGPAHESSALLTVSPSQPLRDIVVRTTGATPSLMSPTFSATDCVEAAIALALGFAEEQKTLLAYQAGEHTQRTSALTATSTDGTPLLASATPFTSPPSLDFSTDNILENTAGNMFVSQLLTKMSALSREASALRVELEATKQGRPSFNSLLSTCGAASAFNESVAQRKACDEKSEIATLKKRLRETETDFATLRAEAKLLADKERHMRLVVAALVESSDHAFKACGTLASARNSSALNSSKWRAKALQVNPPQQSVEEAPIGIASAVSDAENLASQLAEAMASLCAVSSATANAQQLGLSAALCQLLNRSDVATATTAAKSATLASETTNELVIKKIDSLFTELSREVLPVQINSAETN